MNPANISLFTDEPIGGRAQNDANNKTREHIILRILNRDPECQALYNHPVHGPAWIILRDSLYEAIDARFGQGSHLQGVAVPKGGRRFNWDYDYTLQGVTHKLELKVGNGTHVDNLPEFFNPAVNYDFHNGASYAGFFYDNYLGRILAIYPAPDGFQMPTREWYIQKVRGTSRIPALFAHLHTAEVNGTDNQKRIKKEIVDESIGAWLTQTRAATNVEILTREFLRSQSGKIFLLYDRGTQRFYTDTLTNNELTVQSVVEIRNNNVLVLQSQVATTTFHMLLRWKNHAGVLYPAWQISMRR